MEQLIDAFLGAVGLFVAAIVMLFVFTFAMMMFSFVVTVFFTLISLVLDIALLPITLVDVGLMALIERKLGRPLNGLKEELAQYGLLALVNTCLIAAAASYWIHDPLRAILPAIAIGVIAAISASEWSFVPSLFGRNRKKANDLEHAHSKEKED